MRNNREAARNILSRLLIFSAILSFPYDFILIGLYNFNEKKDLF
ncbi:hypothetical protein CHCC14820_4160 [Bacillus paralicheniformis]|uniref:Uncharacterized protein n=1 Tax=Bacillus paralicheniformis TaxID=1648923 RepID=A0A6N2FLJ9_9BACI|nr:hypothetical protein SC10_B2orf02159 [Bacillus paralicheniformis]OLF98024.1 hypothetical protein B4121_0651 [Bacillus paralicheniformis]OLG06768.1 hypothetical protein B4125_0949 [Bacillus paralicheniformis]OLG11839.1 hypothetical protein B4123_1718 [Bacillus paralicheniformis]TWJ39017.1 hypothetical protein CHCC5027_3939 [Bacillus paralicheniformis]